jgi:hypothetical protein
MSGDDVDTSFEVTLLYELKLLLTVEDLDA